MITMITMAPVAIGAVPEEGAAVAVDAPLEVAIGTAALVVVVAATVGTAAVSRTSLVGALKPACGVACGYWLAQTFKMDGWRNVRL